MSEDGGDGGDGERGLNARLDIIGDGEVDISERFDDGDNINPSYRSESLTGTENEDGPTSEVEIEISVDQDGRFYDGAIIEVSRYHLKNTETGRVFHARLAVSLPWSEVERIRNFIDFLLKARSP